MPNKEVQFEQPSALLLFFNRFWIISTAILVGVLLLGGYYLFIQPKVKSNEELRDAALQTSVDQENSKQLLNNLEDLKRVYNDILTNRQNDIERLREIIPNNPQVAELFLMADRLSRQYGMSLEQISISEAKEDKVQAATLNEDGEPVSDTKAVADTTKKNLALKTLSVSFVVTPMSLPEEEQPELDQKSNYQSFKEYLEALEKNLRLVDIQTISFTNMESTNKTAPSYNFTVQTYYR